MRENYSNRPIPVREDAIPMPDMRCGRIVTPSGHSYVGLQFGNRPPMLTNASNARRLAEALIEMAEVVEEATDGS